MGSDSEFTFGYNTILMHKVLLYFNGTCVFIYLKALTFSEKKAFYVDGVCYMHKAINKAASLTYIQCIQFRSKNYFPGGVRQSFIA